jgi:serine phosphatase RsbU (regulator of sigma subunit)
LGFQPPLLLEAAMVALLWLFPLSFAYAVVKHRVLEIPVLLRLSARYLLVQRGFLFLQVAVSVGAAVAFAWGLSRTQVMTPVGLTGGIIFGSALALGGIRVHKATSERIDRAFFRSAYDARMILQDLAERTRTANDRQELAALLEHHLNQALRPSSLAVYLETSDHQISAACGDVPPELETLSATQPMLADLARRGRPWDVSEEGRNGAPEPFLLAPLHPDCLVPMLGRDSRLVGLLVLGPRLSEEPYSREDKSLLAAVASQAGAALESIRLGERIAERIEAERRTAQEMEFAREVQARLLPQKLPQLKTLEYTAGCIPARQVGGDYYDFLELRPGRLALVLADIAGKGVSGALLMANLQANLRSQYAMALDDLPRLLRSVNHLFYENTPESSYATLFFADYDDSSRRLRFVNCGHCPPMLLRSNGTVERLAATATVLGLFDNWECSINEVSLNPDDTLLIYSDGVTEAENDAGEEFGETRLLGSVEANRHLSAPALLQAILSAVEQFSSREQQDDITLVVARSSES